MLCKNRPKRKEENAIFFLSHDVLQTHFVPKFQSEDSKGNFIEFSTDIIFSTFFDLYKTGFEQSNFARIFNLIAFLRRSKTISSWCLPRNLPNDSEFEPPNGQKTQKLQICGETSETALRAPPKPSSRRVLSHHRRRRRQFHFINTQRVEMCQRGS